MQEILMDIRSFYLRPQDFFAKIAAQRKLLRDFSAYAVISAICYLAEFLLTVCFPGAAQTGELSGQFGFIVLLSAMAVGIPLSGGFCLALAGIQHMSARVCGGQGSYKAFAGCFYWFMLAQLASIPVIAALYLVFGSPETMTAMLIEGQPPNLVMVLAYIVFGIVMLAWMIWLEILALKACYALSNARAVLALFLPFLVAGMGLLAIFFAVS